MAFCTTTMKTVSSTVLRSAPKRLVVGEELLEVVQADEVRAPPTPLQSVNA